MKNFLTITLAFVSAAVIVHAVEDPTVRSRLLHILSLNNIIEQTAVLGASVASFPDEKIQRTYINTAQSLGILSGPDLNSSTSEALRPTATVIPKGLPDAYWGVSTVSHNYSIADVARLQNSGSLGLTVKPITVAPGKEEYIVWASRKALGTRQFRVSGFVGGFLNPESVVITNKDGLSETYYVYRSTNKNLGVTMIEVL